MVTGKTTGQRDRGARAVAGGCLALLLLATLTACGGSGDDTGTAAPATEDGARVTSDDTEHSDGRDDAGSTGSETDRDSGASTTTSDTDPSDQGDAEVSTTVDGDGDDGAGGDGVATTEGPVAGTTGPAAAEGDGAVAIGRGPIDPGLQPYIDQAVAELVDGHGYLPGDITVESARLVQWRTSAAGCPQPRMQYAQVVTDGSAIELVAGGQTFWFHSGGSDGLKLCTSPLREPALGLDS